jgi:hypothetical protein
MHAECEQWIRRNEGGNLMDCSEVFDAMFGRRNWGSHLKASFSIIGIRTGCIPIYGRYILALLNLLATLWVRNFYTLLTCSQYSRPPLNGNKIKHYISWAIKCNRKIDTFSNTGPYKAPYVLSRSPYEHTSRRLADISFHSLGSSDDSVSQLSHILHLLTVNSVLYNTLPLPQIQRGRGQGMSSTLPIQRSGISCPERHEHDGSREVVHHVTGKCPTLSHYRHCPGTPYGVTVHVIAKYFLSLSDAYLNASVNWCYLVRVHLIKLALIMGVGFQLCQPQNAIHFFLHGKHILNWSKLGRNSPV